MITYEPTDKQTKEFWTHWGFTDINGYPKFGYTGKKPDGKYANLSINITNLFKQVVPLLEKELGYKETYKLLIRWITEIMDGRDPALALFWPIYEVIK